MRHTFALCLANLTIWSLVSSNAVTISFSSISCIENVKSKPISWSCRTRKQNSCYGMISNASSTLYFDGTTRWSTNVAKAKTNTGVVPGSALCTRLRKVRILLQLLGRYELVPTSTLPRAINSQLVAPCQLDFLTMFKFVAIISFTLWKWGVCVLHLLF